MMLVTDCHSEVSDSDTVTVHKIAALEAPKLADKSLFLSKAPYF